MPQDVEITPQLGTAGRGHGPWTITVDFGFASGEERGRVPDLIAGILREFEVTPARLDVFVDDC
jgi:hypothetical protein